MVLNPLRGNPPNASQQLKRAGIKVIVFSALAFIWAAAGLLLDQEKLFALLFVCVTCWGLATGVALLRLRPWARLSMLVFHSLLIICAALSVVFLVILPFTTPNKGIVSVRNFSEAIFLTGCFVLVSASIAVRGLRFFRRSDIRAQFGPRR